MKFILQILICFLPLEAIGQNFSELKDLFKKSIESEYLCDSILTICDELNGEDNPIISAFYSAALIVKAKHLVDPIKKLSLFNEGKVKLDALVLHNPKLTELRILRLTLQSSIPKFLGYNNFIDFDKQHIFAKPERIYQYESFMSY